MNKEKYINSLYFRNNIRVLDERQLKEMYDKAFEKPFEVFLTRYFDTKELDPDFFYLSNALNKRIIDVLNLYRFDGKRTKEELDTINRIIIELNEIKAVPESKKEDKRREYKNKEEVNRGIYYDENSDILYFAGEDIILYDIIENADSVNILKNMNNDNFNDEDLFIIQGINNFIEVCPELFEDEEFKNNAHNLLDSITPNRKEKKHIKMIKKQIKKY